jgi:hypothetical protein
LPRREIAALLILKERAFLYVELSEARSIRQHFFVSNFILPLASKRCAKPNEYAGRFAPKVLFPEFAHKPFESPKLAVVGSSTLVGSSNFTYPGLTDNVELNIHEKQRVGELQDWYERHWNEAEDVTPEILKVFEHHSRDYQQFEIYAKALHEYFRP